MYLCISLKIVQFILEYRPGKIDEWELTNLTNIKSFLCCFKLSKLFNTLDSLFNREHFSIVVTLILITSVLNEVIVWKATNVSYGMQPSPRTEEAELQDRLECIARTGINDTDPSTNEWKMRWNTAATVGYIYNLSLNRCLNPKSNTLADTSCSNSNLWAVFSSPDLINICQLSLGDVIFIVVWTFWPTSSQI